MIETGPEPTSATSSVPHVSFLKAAIHPLGGIL
jgi:hypothetical protein